MQNRPCINLPNSRHVTSSSGHTGFPVVCIAMENSFFLQQMISARNWEGGHWWVCLPLPLLYLIFSVIYWAAGGTNDVRKTRLCFSKTWVLLSFAYVLCHFDHYYFVCFIILLSASLVSIAWAWERQTLLLTKYAKKPMKSESWLMDQTHDQWTIVYEQTTFLWQWLNGANEWALKEKLK